MPINAFNSFTDGLDSNRRSREHFIANINVEDDRLWVPYAEGVAVMISRPTPSTWSLSL